MAAYLGIVVSHLLAWLAVASAALYGALVLIRYNTDGANYRFSLDPKDPVKSVETLLVWLGVKVLAVCLRFGRAVLNVLLEASAEVGEWLMRHSPTVKENIRSRFLG
jgi:hypothetical protein